MAFLMSIFALFDVELPLAYHVIEGRNDRTLIDTYAGLSPSSIVERIKKKDNTGFDNKSWIVCTRSPILIYNNRSNR